MTRYQALRRVGCGPVTAGLIALANWAAGTPEGEIRVLTLIIEFDPREKS